MIKPYYQIVRDALSANIASGRLPAGTRLLATAVADRLGVSRPPVKRALELLERDGVVAAWGAQGYIVGGSDEAESVRRPNLHQMELDLPAELVETLGQPSWERIYAAAEADVLNCIPFGTFQVSEAVLGDYFGVSRTVVREVLSRMDARALISKDRSSHWLAGPLGARMLDDAHDVRRLLEPDALSTALPALDPQRLQSARRRIEDVLAAGLGPSPAMLEVMEAELHVSPLAALRNRRLAETVALSQVSLVINRLFGKYIGLHGETELLQEHRLVFDHLLAGDGEGAGLSLRRHLDADHQRSRARLKVLSVFDTPDVAPYLTRIH